LIHHQQSNKTKFSQLNWKTLVHNATLEPLPQLEPKEPILTLSNVQRSKTLYKTLHTHLMMPLVVASPTPQNIPSPAHPMRTMALKITNLTQHSQPHNEIKIQCHPSTLCTCTRGSLPGTTSTTSLYPGNLCPALLAPHLPLQTTKLLLLKPPDQPPNTSTIASYSSQSSTTTKSLEIPTPLSNDWPSQPHNYE
ncbi:hypothetical protein PSTT_14639, partial [Puccinia striiformis]